MLHRVTDWSAAYSNGANIPEGHKWPGVWQEPAAAFRRTAEAANRSMLDVAYGAGERQRLDLFLPSSGTPRGLVVFVHGGYWMALDKSYWSHFAAGPIGRGYAVAMPSYTLCPQARVGEIGREIGEAIRVAAGHVAGPLRLIGHSAGGQLVARMACTNSPLSPPLRARLAHVVSLSGVHDLRPILRTGLNETIGLDEAEALGESPALLAPLEGLRLTCWAGAGERAEFLRQSALLANIWKGLGAATQSVEEPDRHHFNVLDGLRERDHPLTRTLLDE